MTREQFCHAMVGNGVHVVTDGGDHSARANRANAGTGYHIVLGPYDPKTDTFAGNCLRRIPSTQVDTVQVFDNYARIPDPVVEILPSGRIQEIPKKR